MPRRVKDYGSQSHLSSVTRMSEMKTISNFTRVEVHQRWLQSSSNFQSVQCFGIVEETCGKSPEPFKNSNFQDRDKDTTDYMIHNT